MNDLNVQEIELFGTREIEYFVPADPLNKILRLYVHKRVTSIVHYAHYQLRMLMKYGIIAEDYVSITPTPKGYVITIHIEVKGVEKAVLRNFLPLVKRVAYGYTPHDVRLRDIEKTFEDIEAELEELKKEREVESVEGGSS